MRSLVLALALLVSGCAPDRAFVQDVRVGFDRVRATQLELLERDAVLLPTEKAGRRRTLDALDRRIAEEELALGLRADEPAEVADTDGDHDGAGR